MRRTPGRAASYTRSSASRPARSIATSRWSAGSSTGIERLSALPRGTGAIGFYKDKEQNVPIASIRMASDMPASERPAFEYLDPASPAFAAWLHVKANRKDDFYEVPAGGVDMCNAQVPVRKKGLRLRRPRRACRGSCAG